MVSNHLHVEVLRRPLESAQYTAISFTDALIEAGIAPSIGKTSPIEFEERHRLANPARTDKVA
jgi:hypothetical protein